MRARIKMNKKPLKLNVFSENIYEKQELDEKRFVQTAKKLLKFYLKQPEIARECCLCDVEYDSITFDFVYCDSVKTHEINREYRGKDYPADIITFAIFADTPPGERFIFDGDVNLGEIFLALDKIKEEAAKKEHSFEYELSFLISHGILHLLGFDHQTMEDYNFIVGMQNKALESIGINEQV